MLSSVFDSFVKKSPISVMARGVMERTLNPDQLNQKNHWGRPLKGLSREKTPPHSKKSTF